MTALDLSAFREIVFFTGAGMSAECGVPTYRGRGGIWHQYNYEDYACQRAFDRDPQKVLDFHEVRRTKVLQCQPHAGHLLIARLQQSRAGVHVVTQNIDGMFQRAGVTVEAELHGSLWRVRCPRHGIREDRSAGCYASRTCPQCAPEKVWLRPDIVWFEDAVDEAVFARAGELVRKADLFVSVGTSGVVWPAAGFVRLAREAGAHMIEINPEETEASSEFDLHLREPASVALPELFPLT
jgi:NAD-dependent deacetylase